MKTSIETQIIIASLFSTLAAISLTELIEKGGHSPISAFVFIVSVGLVTNISLRTIIGAIREKR